MSLLGQHVCLLWLQVCGLSVEDALDAFATARWVGGSRACWVLMR